MNNSLSVDKIQVQFILIDLLERNFNDLSWFRSIIKNEWSTKRGELIIRITIALSIVFQRQLTH